MMSGKINKKLKQLLTTIIVVGSCVSYAAAQAVDEASWHNTNQTWSQNNANSNSPVYQTDIRSRPTANRWAQNNNGSLRSKGEVINDVKRRYNATVLKIRLNEKRAVYDVRILMPSGKVKSIQVSAVR